MEYSTGDRIQHSTIGTGEAEEEIIDFALMSNSCVLGKLETKTETRYFILKNSREAIVPQKDIWMGAEEVIYWAEDR